MRAPICIVGVPILQRRYTTAPSRITTRRSASIRHMRLPMRFAGGPMKTRETPPGPGRISTRRRGSGGERNKPRQRQGVRRGYPPRSGTMRAPTIAAASPKGRLRRRHQGLRRGDPPRSEICEGLLQPRHRLLQQGRLRPRHQGFRRGDPPRSEICGCLLQSRQCLQGERG